MWKSKNLTACSRNVLGDISNQLSSLLQVNSQNNVFNAAQDNNPTFAGPGVITDQGHEAVAWLLFCLSQVGQYIVCHILNYYSMGHERLPPPHKRLKTLGALLTQIMTGLVLKCCCRYKPPEWRHTPLPWRV